MAKRIVPRRNIEPVLVDIKRRDFNYRTTASFADLNLTRVLEQPADKTGVARHLLGRAVLVSILILAVFGGFAAVRLSSTKTALEYRGEAVAHTFIASLKAFKSFQPTEAKAALTKNREELLAFDQLISDNPVGFLINAVSGLVPALRDAGTFVAQLTELNLNLLQLSERLYELQQNGFYYLQHDGTRLIEELKSVRVLIADIQSQVGTLRNTAESLESMPYFSRLDGVIEDYYVSYSSDLYKLEKFLGGITAFVGDSDGVHVLVLFQNPSEMRPAGGFIGSYADVTLKDGELAKIDVRDIYDPDGQLNIDTVPPEPLQYITTDWEARDANWFFNFPDSAESVLYFMELSKMYSEKNITFDAVIALNVNVIESILDVVEPIFLEEYDLTVDSGNFLEEVQREVEAGDDKSAGHPKRILKVLAPIILERLSSLSTSQRELFVEILSNHITRKDVMMYARDPDIALFLKDQNLDGSVADLPSSFWGSYFAVVTANVDGGKTDAVINQSIELWVDVGVDGGTVSDVKITRVHHGDEERDFWYRVPNTSYIKLFTMPTASLIFLEGNNTRTGWTADYKSLDYKEYPPLAAIESTKTFLKTYEAWSGQEAGKRVFGTWLDVSRGDTATLSARYQIPSNGRNLAKPGKTFRFVFDRQSGTQTSLTAIITAPLGYLWAESDAPVFVYKSDDPPGRVLVDLTLVSRLETELVPSEPSEENSFLTGLVVVGRVVIIWIISGIFA